MASNSELQDQGQEIDPAKIEQSRIHYFASWWKHNATTLYDTDSGGEACNIAVDSLLNEVRIETIDRDNFVEQKIPGTKLRYCKEIQTKHVLLSWYDDGQEDGIAWTWFTYRHGTPSVFVQSVQDLINVVRPHLKSILTYEALGTVTANLTSTELVFKTYLFIIDRETVTLFEDSLKKCSAKMFFYKEPGENAVEQVLSRKDIGQCEVKSPKEQMIFKYDTPGSELLLSAIRRCSPLPKNIFRDGTMQREYLAEWQVQHHMAAANANRGATSSETERPPQNDSDPRVINYEERIHANDLDNALSMSVEYHFQQLISALQAEQKNLPESDENQLAIMWITIEADIQEIISKGLVPGSSIKSGGLNPNSFDHFSRCIDEIQDALFEESYPRAVSQLRGTKEVFSECCYSVVKQFFRSKSELELLKMIYFRSKQ